MLTGASATGEAAARLGTWVAPGEDIRKIRPMTVAGPEMRGLCLMSALAMWDMHEQGAAAMPLGSPSPTTTESKIRAQYLGQKLEAAQSRGQSARTALRLALVSQQIVHPRPLCEGGCRQTTTCSTEGSRMDVHKNARTTPWSRALIAQRVHAGETVAAVARGFSICDRTARKWVARA